MKFRGFGFKKYFMVNFFNPLMRFFNETKYPESDFPEFNLIRELSRKPSAINDHLVGLFTESLSVRPQLIVELGVRRGDSTKILEQVAVLFDTKLISVDILESLYISPYENRIFVQKDDIEFAKEFHTFCESLNMEPLIDVLFIDTSHLYEHTVDEIKSWFPFLSERAKVFFHDTNLRHRYSRKDGSRGIGWDNERGVIRALEEYLNTTFDEDKEFIRFIDGWLIKHYPYCNGFTVLEKLLG